jgi:hypothetical protein
MVFCTLKTGLFGLIFEGQLMVRIRHIKSENEKLFLEIFPLEILGCKSIFYGQNISSQKNWPGFCKSEINNIYKGTSVRIEEIEKTPSPLKVFCSNVCFWSGLGSVLGLKKVVIFFRFFSGFL